MVANKLISKEVFATRQLAFKEAQSRQRAAQIALRRVQQETQAMSLLLPREKVQMELIKNKIVKVRLAIKRKRMQLKDAEIIAPIAGIISLQNIQVGKKVTPNEKVFSIVDHKHLQIPIGVPQKELRSLRKGLPVKIFNEVLPFQDISEPQGTISYISPVVEQKTGMVKLIVSILPAHVHVFRPGMFVSLHILLDSRTNVTLIPKKARLLEQDRPLVFVAKESHARKIYLTPSIIGLTDRLHYQVLDKIKPGDLLIIEGQFGLKDGSPIRINSPKNP